MSRAWTAPSKRTADTGTEWCRSTKYSWNETSLPSAARVTTVDTRSSHIGSNRWRTPHAAPISAVTVVSDAPSARRTVR